VSAWSEARAGLHAGALAAAQTLTHGMIVFATLGAAGVAFGVAGAFAASALAGIAIALFGASRPLIGTTTAATALVAGSVVAAAAPATLGEAVLLAMLLTCGAGLLMLIFAGAGFSRLAALVPVACRSDSSLRRRRSGSAPAETPSPLGSPSPTASRACDRDCILRHCR
jgi:MFS superfamily sulfate permease-like transporter